MLDDVDTAPKPLDWVKVTHKPSKVTSVVTPPDIPPAAVTNEIPSIGASINNTSDEPTTMVSIVTDHVIPPQW